MKYFAVITTCGSEEEAVRIADQLLNTRMIACANWWPIGSAYWWEGECEHTEEFMVFMKTTEEKLEQVKSAVTTIHSYQNPEVIQIQLAGGSKNYLDWIEESVK
jgi:periplasmic divalent cation tolerance protein